MEIFVFGAKKAFKIAKNVVLKSYNMEIRSLAKSYNMEKKGLKRTADQRLLKLSSSGKLMFL